MTDREQMSSLLDIEEVERIIADGKENSKTGIGKPHNPRLTGLEEMHLSRVLKDKSLDRHEKTFQADELDEVLRELDKLEVKQDDSVAVNQGNLTKNNEAMIMDEIDERNAQNNHATERLLELSGNGMKQSLPQSPEPPEPKDGSKPVTTIQPAQKKTKSGCLLI
eukprot:TRINITY_DN5619_c0_g2_i1.p1 TRINITY_DN5619_c0_g2~~TRINITY_DN5619_c0_g2_i1.p1  ORF type:complete len:165 (+),score=47.47 TRINITY_DN5619_c0_g2_i1:27-521(+)